MSVIILKLSGKPPRKWDALVLMAVMETIGSFAGTVRPETLSVSLPTEGIPARVRHLQWRSEPTLSRGTRPRLRGHPETAERDRQNHQRLSRQRRVLVGNSNSHIPMV